ncbi:hypothetical protein E0H75_18405 [Kribbella capetownensis]|uniref:Barstar (barnase inhibitor) domain-containing protein n=1 Tax=Kribbella capetownensis TaxID=1572659 RepID=A0A4R0JQ35_9ACTN|nr:hypothetical protein [Kribbella capetownensis]TCC48567.1 hypothetical protein E0H75_18405 [Kribbella capetownensis]
MDVEARMPWLTTAPYLVEARELDATLRGLGQLGFWVVRAEAPEGGDVKDGLLVELSVRLGFSSLGAGSWAAFGDRLWDLLTARDETPVAVVIEGADLLLRRSLHTLVRCVHKLVSMTEGVGLSDAHAQRQVEYFFVGEWGGDAGAPALDG